MRNNVFIKCVMKYSPLFVLEMLLSWILAQAVVEGNSLIGTAVDTLLAGQTVEYGSFFAISTDIDCSRFCSSFF